MINIDNLKFDENGLIPAVVVDSISKKVLTVAYMNRESLKISMEKGLTCFWSRSRGELWLKGETSGNYQHIVSITADCDMDALTVVVDKEGPACHLGTDSCFENVLWESEERHEFSLEALMKLIEGRKLEKKGNDKKETIYEIADLAYHVMVLMIEMGISLEDIHRELASRHVIDHKVKQEKMTE